MRLFLIALETYIFVAVVLLLLAISNLIFTQRGARFFSQLQMIALWPIAICSKAGRTTLIQTFKDLLE